MISTISETPRQRNTFRIRLVVVALVWLVSTAWFVRFEACAHRFTGRHGGYRDLFQSGIQIRDLWMRILVQDVHVGYAHSMADIDEDSPDRRQRLTTIMEMDFAMLGTIRRLSSRLEAVLDAASRLQTFQFNLQTEGYTTAFKGHRKKGDLFEVEIVTASGSSRIELNIPDDVILESPVLEQALADLKPGQSRVFRILDPATLAISDLRVTAIRQESLPIADTVYPATLLEAVLHGMTIRSWVDAEGRLLRQETPMGWTLERAEPEAAVAWRRPSKTSPIPDMTLSVSIPVSPPLPNPRTLKTLTLQLSGLQEWNVSDLETDRQTVLRIDETSLVVRIAAMPPPSSENKQDFAKDTDPPDSLAPTPFIQSDHPEIRRRARAIAKTVPLNDPWAFAKGVNRWVFENVRKTPTPSLPSAADVLATLKGDCNEHAYLAVALLRALGLPARVMAGLVYLDGAFSYHAWVALRIHGRWVEMDPTFDQEIADATHLALVHGELAAQAAIARYLGRLQISVLEYEEGNPSP